MQKNRFHSSELATFLLIITLGVLIFLLLLLPREIQALKTISVLYRYNITRIVPLLIVLLTASLLIKKPIISKLAVGFVVFSSFALALNGLWASAYSENYALAGLVPRSDAYYFYYGSINLLERGFLHHMARRRPVFGVFLSFLLWTANGNLQIVLGIIAFLAAAACFSAVTEVKRSAGTAAAVIFFLVQFLFIRRFLGITMSENLGFILGTIGFSLLLISMRFIGKNDRSGLYLFISGALFFSLAQAARPGALATIPILIILAGWLFRGGKKFSWKIALLVLLAASAGFLLSSLQFEIFTQGEAVQTNNWGYGLYGVAVGGKGWKQIYADHPEINSMQSVERERYILKLIINEITRHPLNFVKGIGVQLRTLFSIQYTYSIFSFVYSSSHWVSIALMATFLALLLIGLAICLKNRKEPMSMLVLALLAGILFSLPVAPPYQTQYMRVYAASIPFVGFLPGLGLAKLMKFFSGKINFFKLNKKVMDEQNQFYVAATSTIIFLIVVVLPFIILPFLPGVNVDEGGCEAGEDEAVVDFVPASSVHIFANTPDRMTWVPYVSQLDYKRDIHNICCEDEIQYFKNIPTPNTIFTTVNILNSKGLYIIADESDLPDKRSYLRLCGYIENVRGKPSESGFFYPSRIEVLDF